MTTNDESDDEDLMKNNYRLEEHMDHCLSLWFIAWLTHFIMIDSGETVATLQFVINHGHPIGVPLKNSRHNGSRHVAKLGRAKRGTGISEMVE